MNVRKLTFTGLFLALGLVLPFLTGQLPQMGNALLPMHIPVLLCGIICGWQYGFLIGLVLPPLRYLLFSTPPLQVFPPMAFELATYGAVIGLVYMLFKNKNIGVFVALFTSMIAGRAVFGIVNTIIFSLTAKVYTFKMFFTAAFVTAIPGIILQVILIPSIVLITKKAMSLNER